MPTISPATGFRYFSKGFGDAHASPAFQYVQESGVVWSDGHGVYTGAWRPVQSTDLGSTTNLSVSGLSLTVGSVAVTGNPNFTVSNPLLATSGVVTILSLPSVTVAGGQLSVAVTGGVISSSPSTAITGNPTVIISGFNPIWVTGNFTTSAPAITAVSGNVQANITNTAPIAISGVVNTTVTVGNVAITGFDSRIPPLAVSGSLTVAAAAITPISGFTVDTVGNQLLSGISGRLTVLVPISGAVNANITNTAPIAISGVVNTTVTITNVAVTGQVAIASASLELALLSGISGQLTANLAGSAPISGDIRNIPGTLLGVTGTVVIPFTSPIYVTGSFSSTINNPVGITGTTRDLNPVFSGINSYPSLFIAGRAVNPSGIGSPTGYRTGDAVIFNFDAANGALLVEQGILDRTQDQVTIFPASTGTASANVVSGIAGAGAGWGTPLPSNSNRRAWGITNLSTGVMFVRMGTLVNSGNAHFILKGGVAQNDGLGASYIDAPAIWNGPISVSGYFSTNATYSAWEL